MLVYETWTYTLRNKDTSCDQVHIGKMEQQWEHSAVHNVFG
jgi:hypothetical protein